MQIDLFEIYVAEMIDDWARWNLCPIIDGKMDLMIDHPATESVWGQFGSQFILATFGERFPKGMRKLSTDAEELFYVLALENEKMWGALKLYIEYLHLTQSEFSQNMHMAAFQMLTDDPVFKRPKKQGGQKKGKYEFRDILIAVTVDIWREKGYINLPIKKNDEHSDPNHFDMFDIIHAALSRVKPDNGPSVPTAKSLHRIYREVLKKDRLEHGT